MSVALVTGGGQGIGRAVCAALVGDGWDVVLNDADAARAEAAAAEIGRQAPGRVAALGGDIADPAAVEACVEAALARFGGLDAAVANAGITTFAPFLEMPRAEVERLLAVNLLGTWQTAQVAARALADAGGGSIVLLSSVVGLRAVPGLAAYGMTKAAIAGLARSLAVELGPLGIAVNAVAPGATITERTLEEQPRYAEDWGREIPLGRAAEAADVAETVRFLLGPGGRQISGQTIVVDGGWSGQGAVPPGY
jgi:3-oxoacyl-[acyl-carrier protein] reductase